MGGVSHEGNGAHFLQGGTLKLKPVFPRGEWCGEIKVEQMFGKGSYLTGDAGVSWCTDFKVGVRRGVQLTGVCKNEIIATNRPPPLDSRLRRNDRMGPVVSIWGRFCI